MLLISANESEEVSNLRSPHVSQLELETGAPRARALGPKLDCRGLSDELNEQIYMIPTSNNPVSL